jgi:hypothetical protein
VRLRRAARANASAHRALRAWFVPSPRYNNER